MFSRSDGFMFHGTLVVDLFSTSELLHLNMKFRLRLIRARPSFYMISDNPNVNLGIVDCSLYTDCIALKDDYHKTRLDILGYTLVDFNCLENLAKIFVILAGKNQFIQENIRNKAPVCRNASALSTNSPFTGSYTKIQFWYQQFDLRQVRLLRCGQPNVDFDAADNCRLDVTTMKAMNFQGEIPSIGVHNFKDHYV